MLTFPILGVALWLLLASCVPAPANPVSGIQDFSEPSSYKLSIKGSVSKGHHTTVDCHFDNDEDCQWKNVEQTDTKDWQLTKTDPSGHKHSGAMRYVSAKGETGSAWLQTPLQTTVCFSFNYALDLQPFDFLRVSVMPATDESEEKVMWQLSGPNAEGNPKQGQFSIDPKYLSDRYRIIFKATTLGQEKASVTIDDTKMTLGKCETQPPEAGEISLDCDFTKDLCGWSNVAGAGWKTEKRKSLEDKFGEKDDQFAVMEGNQVTAQLQSQFIPKGTYCLQLSYYMDKKFKRSLNQQLKVYTMDSTLKKKSFNIIDNKADAKWHTKSQTIKSRKDFLILLEGFTSRDHQYLALDDITFRPGKCKGNEISATEWHECNIETPYKTGCEVLPIEQSYLGSRIWNVNYLMASNAQEQESSTSSKYYHFADTNAKSELVSDMYVGGSIRGEGEHCLIFTYTMKAERLSIYQAEAMRDFANQPIFSTTEANPKGSTEAMVTLPAQSDYRLVFEAEKLHTDGSLVIEHIIIKDGKCTDKYEKCAFDNFESCYWIPIDWDYQQEKDSGAVLYAYPRNARPHHSLLVSEILQPSIHVQADCFTFRYRFSEPNLGTLRVMLNTNTSTKGNGTIVEFWHLNSNDPDSGKFTRSWQDVSFNIDEKWLGAPFRFIIDAQDIIEPTKANIVEIDNPRLLSYSCEDSDSLITGTETVCEDPKCFSNFADYPDMTLCTCPSTSDTTSVKQGAGD